MFSNIYSGKKVLVTGNTGFKGSWLTLWLHTLGAKVIGISKDVPTNPSIFVELKLRSIVKHYEVNIIESEKILAILLDEKPDFIFHLAAQPLVKESYDNPLDTFKSNTLGTASVLDAVRKSALGCIVVMITSDKCYENVEWTWGYRENDPMGGKDPYSASKGAAELIIRSFYQSFFSKDSQGVKLASVRAGNVIGGGDWAGNRIVPDCIKSWAENKVVEIRSPKATRPWQHVIEPLSGYLRVGQLLAENRKFNGEAYNFGPRSENSYSVLELIHALATKWGFTQSKEAYHVIENTSFHEAGLLKLNCDKALHELAWQPVLSFQQTVDFTADWYHHFYKEKSSKDIFAFTLNQIEKYQQLASEKKIAWTK